MTNFMNYKGPPWEGSFFNHTLGEAALINAGRPHPFSTVQRLLDCQAAVNPTRPAVGFLIDLPHMQDGQVPKYKIYSYSDMLSAAVETAENIRSHWTFTADDLNIALVGRSTSRFFFAWIGLVYLGYSVLLLSPDLKPDAVAHLCEECGTQKLVYDSSCQVLAEGARAANRSPLTLYGLPELSSFQHFDGASRGPGVTRPASEDDIAYYHHSSGTSGGRPKLLPVSHRMAIGVLPFQSLNPSGTTFSTTPIYHGGVADCFRSWAASAIIWLYPGELAMTTTILNKCIAAAQNASYHNFAPALTYISCVPAVLNQFAESPGALVTLKSMRMVGVGGAAMPEQLANRLVNEGVSLLSRYGATECGFLLSSFRDFRVDREWQYLRHNPSVTSLRFEGRDDGLSELIVGSTWPALSKTNRPDGSYATGDLFESHMNLPNAWKYHSRADAQITLSTGKKFDPAPLEDSLRESDLLDDILIFGDDHNYPGALLFKSPLAASAEIDEILRQVWRLVEENKAHLPKHAKLYRSMLVVMPSSSLGLPKSSKGTTLRKQAVDIFKTDIDKAYAPERFQETSSGDNDEESPGYLVQDDEVITVISNIVTSVRDDLGEISVEDDFFNRGVDSSDCIRIRESIQAKLTPPHCPDLPLDVVYDQGNIANLSDYVINFRKGILSTSDDDLPLMKDLVAKYGDWQTLDLRNCKKHGAQDLGRVNSDKEIVVLTGVTGTLGAHILSQLSTQASVAEMHCFVRGTTVTAAGERVRKVLLDRQLHFTDAGIVRIHYHLCDLSRPDLGLEQKAFADLAHRVTLVIHAAWSVNFSAHLSSFVKDNIAGLHNLISFTISSCRHISPHFVFCSSTASATGSDQKARIPESIMDDPCASSKLGYSRSKWVAEHICDQAHRKTYLHNHISILRIGQLCGDTDHGVWNVKEAWPLMLSASKVLGCIPDLGQEPLNWLPVDVAAKALLDIATSSDQRKVVHQELDPCLEDPNAPMIHPCRVYNIVNQSSEQTWVDLIGWMKMDCPALEVVSPLEWLSKLEGSQGKGADLPARALLGFWRGIYSARPDEERAPQFQYDMAETMAASSVMRDLPTIDEEHFLKMWAWIQAEMTRGIAKAAMSRDQEDRSDVLKKAAFHIS